MHYMLRTSLAAGLSCAIAATAATAATSNYYVSNLSNLGGTRNQGNSVNDIGLIAGYSSFVNNTSRHASLWAYGRQIDLGSLGGAAFNSSVPWPVKNNLGILSGITETGAINPLGEEWSCGFFFGTSGNVCVGFVWEWGVMRPLPTLGGYNGFATGTNDWAETVGWAETAQVDSSCDATASAHQQLQFKPVVWGPGRNQIRALPLIAGDSSGSATAINDHGQIVGISGDCDQAQGRRTARHAVLWDHGTVIDIGKDKLPAPFWNTPMAINQRGDVVGFAGDPSDDTGGLTHAFLWTREHGMELINDVPDDNSTATAINEAGQIVGYFAAADGSLHGFIWDHQHGMQDLNDLKQTSYSQVVTLANDINDFGVITGRSVDSTGARFAFVAVPLFSHH